MPFWGFEGNGGGSERLTYRIVCWSGCYPGVEPWLVTLPGSATTMPAGISRPFIGNGADSFGLTFKYMIDCLDIDALFLNFD